MEYFRSKDGREIEPRDHIACFLGKNNSSKGRVLIWLMHLGGKFRTARQIADETGVNYEYIKARLMFWFRIKYVNRKLLIPSVGRPVWSYCIAERGRHFVDEHLPADKFSEYINDINLWRKARAASAKL